MYNKDIITQNYLTLLHIKKKKTQKTSAFQIFTLSIALKYNVNDDSFSVCLVCLYVNQIRKSRYI